MFRTKQTYKSEKGIDDLKRTLTKIIDRKLEHNFKSVLSQIFNHRNDEIVGTIDDDGVKFWRSWSPGNLDVFYVEFNCKARKIKQTTILEVESKFNIIGKYFTLITVSASIVWILKTIYDMIYNYATGMNLLAVLVITLGFNCIPLFSFITYSKQTIEELERICKLSKVRITKKSN